MTQNELLETIDRALEEYETLLASYEHRFPQLPAGNLCRRERGGKPEYFRQLPKGEAEKNRARGRTRNARRSGGCEDGYTGTCEDGCTDGCEGGCTDGCEGGYEGGRADGCEDRCEDGCETSSAYDQIPLHRNTPDGAYILDELLEKRVILHGSVVLRRNIQALRRARNHLQPFHPALFAGDAVTKDGIPLRDRLFLHSQLNAERWLADTASGNYRTNPAYLEELRHPTSDGAFVRSKSEVFWADALRDAGWPYRYDSALRLKNGETIYPDFVVLPPPGDRLVLIEHFGRMDDPRYAHKSMHRLRKYAESGYLPGRDLFFTMETKEAPLTKSEIEAVMDQICAQKNTPSAGAGAQQPKRWNKR